MRKNYLLLNVGFFMEKYCAGGMSVEKQGTVWHDIELV